MQVDTQLELSPANSTEAVFTEGGLLANPNLQYFVLREAREFEGWQRYEVQLGRVVAYRYVREGAANDNGPPPASEARAASEAPPAQRSRA